MPFELFLRVMGVLVLPLFFWWFNVKAEANHLLVVRDFVRPELFRESVLRDLDVQ